MKTFLKIFISLFLVTAFGLLITLFIFPEWFIIKNGESALRVSNIYGMVGNQQQQFVWLTKSLEKGNSEAANELGNLYFNGNGVEKDNKKALFYYQIAAKKGCEHAMFNIGNVELQKAVLSATDSPKVAAKIFYWFKKSNDTKSSICAADMLGIFYQHGFGTKKNNEIAKKYFYQSGYLFLTDRYDQTKNHHHHYNLYSKPNPHPNPNDILAQFTTLKDYANYKISDRADNKFVEKRDQKFAELADGIKKKCGR